MSDAKPIGLPPAADAPAPTPTSSQLWFARGVNLFGLVSPAANLGLVWVAKKDRRWFGLGAGIACFVVLMIAVKRDIAWLQWTAAGAHYTLVLVGLVQPLWVEKIGDAWTAFGKALGAVMVYPIFGAVYFLVVTPMALVLRAFGKDPLGVKRHDAATYWTPHEPSTKERYDRQF